MILQATFDIIYFTHEIIIIISIITSTTINTAVLIACIRGELISQMNSELYIKIKFTSTLYNFSSCNKKKHSLARRSFVSLKP